MKKISVEMDHEGPPPGLKKQKRSTAAEQVTKLQDEYEARGKPSSDKVSAVMTHNENHPKLRNEICKRRSVANVSDVGKSRIVHASRSTHRAGQRKRKRGRRDNNLTRVTKKRSHKANSTNLPTKIFGTKSCQFSGRISVINRRIGTDAMAMADNEIVAPAVVVSETNVEVEPPKETKPPGSSTGSIGSGIASVSSFNSFCSVDQGPMGRES